MSPTRRLFLTAALALALLPGVADAKSAAEILAGVDGNMTFDTRSSKLSMTVTKGSRAKVYELQSYGRGADETAIEFLSPARDKGTKMLKKGGELWMYLPSIEKVQKISGHMLRQGMMGSDFSYEDMMEAGKLAARYDATVVAEEDKDGRPCWKIEMKAKTADVAYPRRVSWIDRERVVPVREELYALSGMLLKEEVFADARQFGTRWFPTTITIDDKLLTDSSTTVRFTEMQFSVPLEAEVFDQRWLER